MSLPVRQPREPVRQRPSAASWPVAPLIAKLLPARYSTLRRCLDAAGAFWPSPHSANAASLPLARLAKSSLLLQPASGRSSETPLSSPAAALAAPPHDTAGH